MGRGMARRFGKIRRGVYVLLIEVWGEIPIGHLGVRRFAGCYAYVGSAQGPGGFRRLLRHHQVAAGARPARRWHIDALLARGVWRGAFVQETGERGVECALARRLARILPPAVPGFGSSDCRCPTHLFAVPNAEALRGALAAMGLQPFLLAGGDG